MSIFEKAKGLFLRTEEQQKEHEARKTQAKRETEDTEEKIDQRKTELKKEGRGWRLSKYDDKDLTNKEKELAAPYRTKKKTSKTKETPKIKKKTKKYEYERGILSEAYREATQRRKKKKKKSKKTKGKYVVIAGKAYKLGAATKKKTKKKTKSKKRQKAIDFFDAADWI